LLVSEQYIDSIMHGATIEVKKCTEIFENPAGFSIGVDGGTKTEQEYDGQVMCCGDYCIITHQILQKMLLKL